MEECPTIGSSTDSESRGVLHRPVTGRLTSMIGRTPQQGSFRGGTRGNAVPIVEKLPERMGTAFPLLSV